MIDIDLIRERGGSEEKLEALFTSKKPKDGVKNLIELGASRINEGINRNLCNARTLWAIDRAYDVSQRQITYTLVEGLISSNRSKEAVLSAVTDWGLQTMLTPVMKDGKPCYSATGEPLQKLDLPTFFNIFVPVVQAYTKIRWAKLFNDRDLFPLYKYDPIRLTYKNKIKSDLITDRIQRMAVEMGYREDERQSILQTLLYASCLNFPMEDWYKEEQLVKEEGKEPKKTTIREGVRFAIPHSSRYAFDQSHRVSTLNTDTGCEWAFYWDIAKYSKIATGRGFWNKNLIDASYNKYGWPRSAAWRVYQELFPCQMSFPKASMSQGGAGDKDRINEASYYTQAQADEAVTIIPMFMKIVPKDFDLYDYEYPVWHRLVYGGEDTIIHAAPFGYSPIVAYSYDSDQNRSFNTSLGLELLPWQDHLGNYLTQYLLSVKKNLGKVVFYNSDQVTTADIEKIRNLGESMYRDYTFIPASKRENSWQQQNTQEAFWPVQFPSLNTQEINQAVNTMLFIMERMLGFSSQELGAPATHEQSASEVNLISLNTSTRLLFTGGFLDSGIRTKKKLLYDAMMAYSSDEILAEVADLDDIKQKALEDMGFKVEEETKGPSDMKAGVRGSKKSLRIEGFASDREGVNRIQDSKVAATMIQTFQSIFSNPAIVQATGVPQLIDLFNQMLLYAGLPRDFRLKLQPAKPGEQPNEQQQAEQVQQQLGAMQQIAGEVAQQVVRGEITQMADAIKKNALDPLQAAIDQLRLVQEEAAKHDAQQGEIIGNILKVLNAAAAINAPQPINPNAPLDVGINPGGPPVGPEINPAPLGLPGAT